MPWGQSLSSHKLRSPKGARGCPGLSAPVFDHDAGSIVHILYDEAPLLQLPDGEPLGPVEV